jgi:hypothetical protein
LLWGNGSINFLRLGTGDVISSDAILYSNPIVDVVKERLGSLEKGLEELRRIYTDSNNLSGLDYMYISIWAAYFSDPEFAMDFMEKVLSLDCSSVFWFWYPLMHEVRQLPRFKELMKEIGLVDCWNEFRRCNVCKVGGHNNKQ